MSRFKAFGPLHKIVHQVGLARPEKRRIKTQSLTWHSERDMMVASGKFDDERAVVAASTLQMKLQMVPFKESQLDDLITSAIAGMGAPLRELRNELAAERDMLIKTATEDLIAAIEPELNRILGHAPELASQLAQQAANASLVLHILSGLDPVGSQNIQSKADQAQSLLELAGTLERLRQIFFTGDKLNLEAVEKHKVFKIAA